MTRSPNICNQKLTATCVSQRVSIVTLMGQTVQAEHPIVVLDATQRIKNNKCLYHHTTIGHEACLNRPLLCTLAAM